MSLLSQLYIILGLVFSLAVAIFAVQNSTAVDVKFLGWSFEDISLVVVILSSVVGGVLISILLGLPRQLRNTMKLRELSTQNQRLSDELEKLSKEKPKSVENNESKESNSSSIVN